MVERGAAAAYPMHKAHTSQAADCMTRNCPDDLWLLIVIAPYIVLGVFFTRIGAGMDEGVFGLSMVQGSSEKLCEVMFLKQ